MHIRPGTRDDVEIVAALHAGSWRAAYRGIMRDAFLDGPLVANRRDEWQAKLASPEASDAALFIATDGPLPRGFAYAFPDPDTPWGDFLDNLHLHPDARGQGLGRQLMAEVARWVLARGGRELNLLVYEPNLAARRFYARQGGVEVERIAVMSPDGTVIPEVRVAWGDVRLLLSA